MAAALDPQTIEAIRTLAAGGMPRNEIARTLGLSGSTVSKWAKRGDDGPEVFDRSQTKVATAAKVADAKSRRAELQLKLLEDAERLRGQLWQPAHAFSFGGKENTYEEHTIDEPTFADKHKIVMAVSTVITASIKIDEHDRANENLSAMDAWLAAHIGNGE